MHLGGIGTGNVELGVDGRLTTWQLFNTLRDGEVPMFFALKTGAGAKLLQTTGGPDVPRVPSIDMVGEYPFAELKFVDSELPVEVQLTAFTPFAPLDSRIVLHAPSLLHLPRAQQEPQDAVRFRSAPSPRTRSATTQTASPKE